MGPERLVHFGKSTVCLFKLYLKKIWLCRGASAWAFNTRLYLESLDLFDHVTGTATAPGEDASEEARRNFNLCAKKACTHICLAIEPERQLHVRETTTAKEAWDRCHFGKIALQF